MAKKKKKKTTFSGRKYKHYKAIRGLAAIGSAVALIFHIVAIVELIIIGLSASLNITGIITAILGIFVDIILLGSLQLINHSFKIKMTWFSLLALGIADAIFTAMSYVGYGQYAALGVLLTLIAAFIAIIDRLS